MTAVPKENWSLENLMELTADEMVELWKTLPAPDMNELIGEYRAHLPMAGTDEEHQKQIKEAMYNSDGPMGIWLGKAYNVTGENEGEGYNHWEKKGTDGFRVLRYKTYIKDSEVDGQPALIMDYTPFRPADQGWNFKDDVRKLNDDLHIGYGFYVMAETGERSVAGLFALTGPIHEWVGADEV
jgi:hypothetical protein